MEWIYRTKQGDTWDVLALDIYGTEMLAYRLQEANPDHLGVIYFPAGVDLVVPETPKTATAMPVAPWRRGEYLSEKAGAE